MLVSELEAIIRYDHLDDTTEPYNWTSAFIVREIGRAQQQACYRQDLKHLFDEDGFNLTLTAGTRSYALDPAILRIDRASYDGADLVHTTRHDLDTYSPGWRNYLAGEPRRFYIVGRTLYLDREPSSAEDGDTLALAVWHEPLTSPMDLTADDDIEWLTDQEQLGHWVAYRAFMRRDEDTQDKENAKMHLALFNATFGEEVPAQVRMKLLQDPDAISFGPDEPARRLYQTDTVGW